MKDLGTCGICKEVEAKYKCPKCLIVYCSLACYKNEELHSHQNLDLKNITRSEPLPVEKNVNSIPNKFDKILNDPQILSMLNMKSLQFHLLTLIKIMSDPSITNEPTMENRRDVAKLKLADLRKGGKEENELVEEFIERFLLLIE